MSTPKHLAGVPAGQEFTVRCGNGNASGSGHFTDYARAQHWAEQAPAAGCCKSTHKVVPVIPRGRTPRRGGWT